MKKIYLFCSAGMSTSMLASNMQSVANDHQLPIKVAAFPHDKLTDIIEEDRPDCILLGPQVRYMYDETVTKYGNEGIPISVIDQGDYGMMNGENVLKSAIKLIKEADTMIIGGTSLTVFPAAYLIDYFHGSNLVLINKDKTSYDDRCTLVINDKLGNVFSKL